MFANILFLAVLVGAIALRLKTALLVEQDPALRGLYRGGVAME